MSRPDNLPVYEELDLKLGIKSSLPHVKSTLALAILFWECTDYPAELIYSEQKDNGIVVTEDVWQKVSSSLASICEECSIDLTSLADTVNGNMLFKSQLEALIVAFELVWKLAKVSFVEGNKAASAERTGGTRYPKKLTYTVNMDIIHCLIESNRDSYIKVLLAWMGMTTNPSADSENQLLHLLTALSESAVFKLTDGDHDVIFNQDSLYRKLIETEEPVDVNGDKEAKGSLRILKSLLSDEMNPFLKYANGSVSADESDEDALKAYQSRVSTYLRLSATKIILPEDEKDETTEFIPLNYKTNYPTDFERNRIIFGAPGTGKSYKIKADCEDLLNGTSGNYERVTFHPDYTYSQFVGTYKPVTDTDGNIKYTFVPGPFMRVFVAAVKSGRTENPQPYVLIIEEINRAKVAAVFGDVFQLLDRDDDGVSEYDIHASEDIKNYLAKELDGTAENFGTIRIPDNMFIWATMNSADQGVYPMDTAFKRRWAFEYLGINANESHIHGSITLGSTVTQNVEWNLLRRAINDKLAKEYKVNEDKLMGPFFLSKKVLKTVSDTDMTIANPELFTRTFKSKVIMYLYEDAAKQHKHKLFSGCEDTTKYSAVCDSFDKIGIQIFGDDFEEVYYNPQKG